MYNRTNLNPSRVVIPPLARSNDVGHSLGDLEFMGSRRPTGRGSGATKSGKAGVRVVDVQVKHKSRDGFAGFVSLFFPISALAEDGIERIHGRMADAVEAHYIPREPGQGRTVRKRQAV